MQFKNFYTVVTANGKWGKGLTLAVAKKAALLTSSKTEHFIYIGIVKDNATEEEVKNINQCFSVNDFGNVVMYDNPSEEDKEAVKNLFVGWITEHHYTPVKQKA